MDGGMERKVPVSMNSVFIINNGPTKGTRFSQFRNHSELKSAFPGLRFTSKENKATHAIVPAGVTRVGATLQRRAPMFKNPSYIIPMDMLNDMLQASVGGRERKRADSYVDNNGRNVVNLPSELGPQGVGRSIPSDYVKRIDKVETMQISDYDLKIAKSHMAPKQTERDMKGWHAVGVNVVPRPDLEIRVINGQQYARPAQLAPKPDLTGWHRAPANARLDRNQPFRNGPQGEVYVKDENVPALATLATRGKTALEAMRRRPEPTPEVAVPAPVAERPSSDPFSDISGSKLSELRNESQAKYGDTIPGELDQNAKDVRAQLDSAIKEYRDARQKTIESLTPPDNTRKVGPLWYLANTWRHTWEAVRPSLDLGVRSKTEDIAVTRRNYWHYMEESEKLEKTPWTEDDMVKTGVYWTSLIEKKGSVNSQYFNNQVFLNTLSTLEEEYTVLSDIAHFVHRGFGNSVGELVIGIRQPSNDTLLLALGEFVSAHYNKDHASTVLGMIDERQKELTRISKLVNRGYESFRNQLSSAYKVDRYGIQCNDPNLTCVKMEYTNEEGAVVQVVRSTPAINEMYVVFGLVCEYMAIDRKSRTEEFKTLGQIPLNERVTNDTFAFVIDLNRSIGRPLVGNQFHRPREVIDSDTFCRTLYDGAKMSMARLDELWGTEVTSRPQPFAPLAGAPVNPVNPYTMIWTTLDIVLYLQSKHRVLYRNMVKLFRGDSDAVSWGVLVSQMPEGNKMDRAKVFTFVYMLGIIYACKRLIHPSEDGEKVLEMFMLSMPDDNITERNDEIFLRTSDSRDKSIIDAYLALQKNKLKFSIDQDGRSLVNRVKQGVRGLFMPNRGGLTQGDDTEGRREIGPI